MTHSLHRQGSKESLKDEYIVIAFGDTYFLAAQRARFRRVFPSLYSFLEGIALKVGTLKILQAVRKLSQSKTKGKSRDSSLLHSKEELCGYLGKLKEANYGKSAAKSVVVSGLFNEVHSCLKELNLYPHTFQFSLGYFGRTELLPRPEVLEVTTMCGHNMVSPKLVEGLVSNVVHGNTTPEEAARVLVKLCSCGIFNEVRAIKIINELAKSNPGKSYSV
jgi:hypothetical protein